MHTETTPIDEPHKLRNGIVASVNRVRILTFLFCSFLALNDLSIYFGIRSESVQAMFSNLGAIGNRNNHLFMPQFMVMATGDYYFVTSVQIEGSMPETEEIATIRKFLKSIEGKKTLVHNQVIRSITRRLCNHGGTVRLSLAEITGHALHLENACLDPVFASENRWIPIRLAAPTLDLEKLQQLGLAGDSKVRTVE
jgi:hypothetical protein